MVKRRGLVLLGLGADLVQAKILNVSLGPLSESAPLINAVNYAASKGALIVFAGCDNVAAASDGAFLLRFKTGF